MQVPFRRTLVDQFSIAFDVYLDILHGVDILINGALQRNTPNWRMLNVCPPCLYHLEDEVQLKPALLATMDGNQSLKLVDNMYRFGIDQEDSRTARTDIWLSPEEVDRFKDEARSTKVRLQLDMGAKHTDLMSSEISQAHQHRTKMTLLGMIPAKRLTAT